MIAHKLCMFLRMCLEASGNPVVCLLCGQPSAIPDYWIELLEVSIIAPPDRSCIGGVLTTTVHLTLWANSCQEGTSIQIEPSYCKLCLNTWLHEDDERLGKWIKHPFCKSSSSLSSTSSGYICLWRAKGNTRSLRRWKGRPEGNPRRSASKCVCISSGL